MILCPRPDYQWVLQTRRHLLPACTCDARWLNRSPESFLRGSMTVIGRALPPAGRDRRLRWNLHESPRWPAPGLYEAMNARRDSEALTLARSCPAPGLLRPPAQRPAHCAVCHMDDPGDAHHAMAPASCGRFHLRRRLVTTREGGVHLPFAESAPRPHRAERRAQHGHRSWDNGHPALGDGYSNFTVRIAPGWSRSRVPSSRSDR